MESKNTYQIIDEGNGTNIMCDTDCSLSEIIREVEEKVDITALEHILDLKGNKTGLIKIKFQPKKTEITTKQDKVTQPNLEQEKNTQYVTLVAQGAVPKRTSTIKIPTETNSTQERPNRTLKSVVIASPKEDDQQYDRKRI